MKAKKSIKFKFNLLIVSLCLFIIIGMLFLSLNFIKKSVTTQMKNDGLVMASIIEEYIEDIDITKDEGIKTTNEVIKEMMFNFNKELKYISVENTNMEIIAHNEKQKLGLVETDARFKDVIRNEEPLAFEFERKDENGNGNGQWVYNVSVPLYDINSDKVIGIVDVGISLDDMYIKIKESMINVLLFASAVLLIAIGIGVFSAHLVTKNLKELMNKSKSLGDGDLTIEFNINSKDEFEELANIQNRTVQKLESLISSVKQSILSISEMSNTLNASSEEVSASMEEIAGSSDSVLNSVSNQNNSIVKLHENIDDLKDILEMIYKEGKDLLKSSNLIEEHAIKGSKETNLLIEEVNEVQLSFKYVNDKIKELSSSVEEITEITNVINSVAGQTNLLALNASIEAARAGEAGRGFSVVAEEIRTLAEQVLLSSDNINNIVGKISSQTKDVFETSNNAYTKIKDETVSIEGSVETFKGILNEVTNLTPKVDVVYDSIKKSLDIKDIVLLEIDEISNSANVVTESVQDITASIEEQTSMTEELSASIEELSAMQEELTRESDQFKTRD
ncbi:methyl-accepting chemotaxis protein [Peptostreptococcaceae bacterium AGR-M142]